MNELLKFFTEQFVLLFSYIVWPMIILFIVFAVKKPLFNLLSRISKLKYADFEADLVPITEELKEVIPVNNYEKKIKIDKKIIKNPNYAITNSWIEFEKIIREKYIKTYPQRDSCFIIREMINDFVLDNKIPRQFLHIIYRLNTIRNSAIHGVTDFTKEEAEEFINNINMITNYIYENL